MDKTFLDPLNFTRTFVASRDPAALVTRVGDACALLGLHRTEMAISATENRVSVLVAREAAARVGASRLEAALDAELEELGPIVVTRHSALVQLLRERGLIAQGAEVVAHVADPASIRGRRVIGVLPLRLAAEALTVTEVEVTLPAELRGVPDLPLEQLRPYVGRTRTYVVREVLS